MCSRRLLAVPVAALLLLPLAATAQADTFCVADTSCPADHRFVDLQSALDAANANAAGSRDTIKVGAGDIPGTADDAFGNKVDIVGAGRSSSRLTGAASGSHITLAVDEPASTVIDVGVHMRTAGTGFWSNGDLTRVAVDAAPGVSAPSSTGIVMPAGSVRDAEVTMPPSSPPDTGVALSTGASAEEVTATATYPYVAGGGNVSLRRVVGTGAFYGFMAYAGTATVSDAVFVLRDAEPGMQGLYANANSADVAVNAAHVTELGPGSGAPAFSAGAGGGHTATLHVRDSIARGFAVGAARWGSGGTASVSVDRTDYTPVDQQTGPGTLTGSGNVDVDPGFVDSAHRDYRLRADSPLVDAGTPGLLTPGESPTDLAGNPRIAVGRAGGPAVRDMGAYEFTSAPPSVTARATLDATGLGQAISFDATGSDPDPGDSLTYSWSWDDGAHATGAVAQHGFSTPGRHAGTVTVTDRAGRTATASASVTVVDLDLPAASGPVAIGGGRIRLTKKGVATLRVTCPPGSGAGCTGTLTLKSAGKIALGATPRRRRRAVALGSVPIAVQRGTTAKVRVKLSRAALPYVRAHGSLAVVAGAVTRDALGSHASALRHLVLLAPTTASKR